MLLEFYKKRYCVDLYSKKFYKEHDVIELLGVQVYTIALFVELIDFHHVAKIGVALIYTTLLAPAPASCPVKCFVCRWKYAIHNGLYYCLVREF